ncbi:MAG: hypothetical protein ABL927_05800 [Bdellovibrionales bacterium]
MKLKKPIAAKKYFKIILILPIVIFLSFLAWDTFFDLYKIARECSPHGYSKDKYLAYCENDNYGDYEHGAFFLNQEPEAIQNLKASEVIFLGNSRMQFAFSNSSTENFFKNALSSQPYYLFGFGYAEYYTFSLNLIKELKLKPKVLVVAVDERYFEKGMSPPAQFVETSPTALPNYEAKKLKQRMHSYVCNQLEPASLRWNCGDSKTIYRHRSTGAWETSHFRKAENFPFELSQKIDEVAFEKFRDAAKDLVQKSNVPSECIIFTSAPIEKWSAKGTDALAKSSGVNSIEQNLKSKWATQDKSHLIPEDALAFTENILPLMKPIFEKCGVRFKK